MSNRLTMPYKSTLAIVAALGLAGVTATWLPTRADTPRGSGVPPLRAWSKQKPRKLRGVHIPAMGCVASDDEDFTRNARLRVVPAKRGERPKSLLLTEYLPPVASQGQQGSCVAWSSAYYCYTYEVAENMGLTSDQLKESKWQFSPAYIYHQGNNGNDNGMQVSRGFELLRDYGCSSLAEMPYDESEFKSPPPDNAKTRAKKYKARRIAHLFRGKFVGGDAPNLERLKTFLADTRTPFVMAIPIFSDFPTGPVKPDFIFNTAVDTKDRNNFYGLHAITVIGYDEDLKAFRMVNSWGTNWGDNGFLWLSDEFVRNYGVEGWSHVAGGPYRRQPRRWQHTTIEPAEDKK